MGGVTDGEHTPPGSGRTIGAASTAARPAGLGPGAPGLTRVIELRGAISLIERFPALAGVDLTVTEGEIILLRGPNGAGKSTLLRLCAGLAPLSDGRGMVLGHDLASRRERRELRRQTGLLAHATFLYDELTVEENLLFWARANRLDLASVEPVLDRLALANRLRNVRVAHLSAGQRRRASLAVLVCRRPRLWLLDEPHAGLDVNGRDFVDGLIKHAVAFGGTVLLASHDFDRAGEIATRTVVVAGGQVQDDDEPTGSSLLPRSASSLASSPVSSPAFDPAFDPAPDARIAGRPTNPGRHADTDRAPAPAPRWDGGEPESEPVSPAASSSPPVEAVQSAAGQSSGPGQLDEERVSGPGSRWRARRRQTAEST